MKLTPVFVDKDGDLKLGKRKCRLHKKDDVRKVAEKFGVSKNGTVKQLCAAIKRRMPAPKAPPKRINKTEALQKINKMKILDANKRQLHNLFKRRSPRHVLRVARELARLR